MKLKHENIIWSIPNLFLNNEYISIIDNLFKEKNTYNPVKIIHGNLFEPIQTCLININYFLDNEFNSEPVLQLNFEKNKNHAIFYDEYFSITMSNLDRHNGEIVYKDDFLYNYIHNKFSNIKIIASPEKFRQESILGREINYYENLLQKCDRVILDPTYVKTKFLEDYKKYSDISKFEIIVDADEDKFLSNSDIDQFSKIGIKYFRLNKIGYSSLNNFEQLFYYIFEPDTYSLFAISEYLDQKYFTEQFY